MNGISIMALALVLNSVLISNRNHKVKKDPTVVGSFFLLVLLMFFVFVAGVGQKSKYSCLDNPKISGFLRNIP